MTTGSRSVDPLWYRYRLLTLTFAGAIGQYLGLLLWHVAGQHLGLGLLIMQQWGERGGRIALMLSLALGTIGFALRIWGGSYLHAAIVWSGNARADCLAIAGPFRFVRNPLYLGNLFLFLAYGLFSTPFGLVLSMLAAILTTLALIAHEERHLRARYGAAFEAYRRAVPRLMPRLHPAPTNGAPADLLAGLRAEVFVFAAFCGLLIYLLGVAHPLLWWTIVILLGAIGQRIVFVRAARSSSST